MLSDVQNGLDAVGCALDDADADLLQAVNMDSPPGTFSTVPHEYGMPRTPGTLQILSRSVPNKFLLCRRMGWSPWTVHWTMQLQTCCKV